MNIRDITKQIRVFADQLESQNAPEAEKPDPYAALKKAHAEGKVIEVFVKDDEYGPDRWSKKESDGWPLPPERYRIKPEAPPFQLPPPPPGMQWHRTDGWQKGDLPQGWRPLVEGEYPMERDECIAKPLESEWRASNNWKDGSRTSEACHYRTRRPLTFTHAGKTWTYHRPGAPMPCDGNRRVFWLYQICDEYSESTEDTASHREWDWSRIIGWRYANKKKTVPFDISDVPPCSVLSLHPPRWFDIYGVCKEGIYVLDDEPLVETLWKWDYLADKVKINRSIPLTGKWNPDAWEPCSKQVDA